MAKPLVDEKNDQLKLFRFSKLKRPELFKEPERSPGPASHNPYYYQGFEQYLPIETKKVAEELKQKLKQKFTPRSQLKVVNRLAISKEQLRQL